MRALNSNTNRRAVVLDTSALLAGFDPFSISEQQYTVPMVRAEIAENSMSGVRFKTATESGKIKVETPAKPFLERVKDSASLVGDSFYLSNTDIQVLGLALQLKTRGYLPLIATDDYSIQNVANQIGIEFASLATFGIRRRLQWMRYCPACHKKYPPNYKFSRCEVCGTELKRKPYKKEHIDR